ncbi:MAG: DNA translocase FtsK 4TM domain-containing protein [Deltaproteobacteria bacterium]|nr:DNA translocase FtsK 4TM domain-containing protein [Deltaproteobacteria bacterium]
MARKTKNKEKTQQKQPTPIRREIRGIIFTLIVVILGVSLFSFHPKDFVFGIKTPGPDAVLNLFGTVGAHLSGWIFFVFGFSSFWLVVAFVAMAILSFQGKRLPSPTKNTVAVLCLAISFAGILGLYLPETISYRGEGVIGEGLLGYYLSGYMQRYLNDFGSYVLLVAAFLLSLMVTTRISFGSILSAIFRWSVMIARPVKEYLEREETKTEGQGRDHQKSQEDAQAKGDHYRAQKGTPKKAGTGSLSFHGPGREIQASTHGSPG